MGVITAVVVGGFVTLVLLAVLIGSADVMAQRAAWKRIARRRHELGEWERRLIETANADSCPRCRLLHERGKLHDQA